MTLAFIPLIPGSLGKADGAGAARLKPMSANFEPTKTVAEPETPHVHRDPKITLERQGETITHIRVECGCGQVIELKCEY
jgi:hypothetical protein